MATKLTKIDELDLTQVQSELQEITARIQEAHPTLDVRRGVFHDLVAYLQAALATLNQVNLDRYLSARSLKSLEDDPTLADEDTVDHVLANFRLDRKVGGSAKGFVTIVISESVPYVFTVNAVFEAEGKTYVTTSAFSSKTSAELVNSVTDRLIVEKSDGTYSWTVEVESVEAGEVFNLKKDTLIVPTSLPTAYVTSYVTEDFLGGAETETNTELLVKLQTGMATTGLSNRLNMTAMLRDVTEFSRFVDTSIVGFGDEEMLRDQHTIWPMSLGGRVDWYVRSQKRLLRQLLVAEAQLVSKTTDDRGVWQVSLGKDDVPGFYEIRNIRLPQAENVTGGFDISSEVRSLDLTAAGFKPDLVDLNEGIYSAFQAAVIQFTDTVTDTSSMSVGDKQNYELEAWSIPLISDIQQHVASRDIRNYAGDILVKAPIPCFVQLSFSITKQATEDAPDLTPIKDALVEEISNVGFIGRLYASQLHDVVHSYLTDGTNVGAVDMFGRIRYPDGTEKYLRSPEVLEVPDDPANMVTAKTVQFYVEPEDIVITVESVIPESV